MVQYQQKKLIRLMACGSVDNGKSTLIGRLMLDSKALMEDQILAVERSRFANRDSLNLAMFTDGLSEERARGVTIDVAYRYFSTPTHKFILADCPGHAEYTRNMATGASNSDLALILVDPLYVLEHGRLEDQTKLHYRICSLFNLPVIFVVNKMDLFGWDGRTDLVMAELVKLVDGADLRGVVISALTGENVTTPKFVMGPSLMELIVATADEIPHTLGKSSVAVVQNQTERGVTATVLSGSFTPGPAHIFFDHLHQPDEDNDPPPIHLSGLTRLGSPATEVVAGDAVEFEIPYPLRLGSVSAIVPFEQRHHYTQSHRDLSARVIWLSDTPSLTDAPGRYLIKTHADCIHTTITSVDSVLDPTSGVYQKTQHYSLMANDIGVASLQVGPGLLLPKHGDSSPLSKFILIDTTTGDTVAAGFLKVRNSDAEEGF